MKLNCDLGESFGAWTMPLDESIMTFIDQANLACGFHAGDPVVMTEALEQAKKHKVTVGAHPSYPDLQGFGRRSVEMSADELKACIQYQVSALTGMAAAKGLVVEYVKPHGALYNDLMRDAIVRGAVMDAVAQLSEGKLSLMIQAHPSADSLRSEADKRGLTLQFEAFADRRYTDDGFLVSRRQPGAVLNHCQAKEQVKRLLAEGVVISESGLRLPLAADTLCVHGDSPDAVSMAGDFRQMLGAKQNGVG